MRFRPDPFIIGIVGAAATASLVPLTGNALDHAQAGIKVVIGVLFFLYGARLSTREALRGIGHWRLQGSILATTFLLFPLLGLIAHAALVGLYGTSLAAGVLLVCFLPSTVQSSITMTSIARGNIAGAVVSASVSNVIGVVATPLLVASFLGGAGQFSTNAIITIISILLLPFFAGQFARRWVSGALRRHGSAVRFTDRAAIVLIVYVAFSRGVSSGAWGQVSALAIGLVVASLLALLGIAFTATYWLSHLLHLSAPDRITLMFCGANKSLASGLPMALVLFDSAHVALIILPLVLYHQLQLLVSSWLASRWARRHD